jgi:SAM-dependent methyltransferase
MRRATKVNLACGDTYMAGDGWINFDYVASSATVRKADLLGRLPLSEDSAALVYSSHFIEHIPRSDVPAFLRECLRVLRPGGVLRLVLPDLEEMARTYLAHRDAGEHERADFLVLEMIDQCVRREPGGELGQLYRRLRAGSAQASEMIAFVRERTGEDLGGNHSIAESQGGALGALAGRYVRGARHRLRGVWLRFWLTGLPAAFRAQNLSLAGVGERHHWLWDFHQLRQALEVAGFKAVERRTAGSSAIADFPFYPLDLDADGRPRKGVESMYVEARKPPLGG